MSSLSGKQEEGIVRVGWAGGFLNSNVLTILGSEIGEDCGTTAPLFWIAGETVSVGVLEETGALWSEDWALHQEKRCKWVSFGNGVPG